MSLVRRINLVGDPCPSCKQKIGMVLEMTITPQDIAIKATCESCHRTGIGTTMNTSGDTRLDLKKALTDNRSVINAVEKAFENLKMKAK